MAKPTYYPDWATQDTTLPATGKANKVRPKETIRNIGWDKGQIPTAEEVNWMFNNWGLWIHYFADEFIPTIPNTYLPKNGTSISFQGDLSGTISWSGANQGTGNIQVIDNSHNHISANITDATSQPTPNMIVKRDAGGTIAACDIISRSSTTTDTPTYFWQNYAGQNIADATCQLGGNFDIRRLDPNTNAVLGNISIGPDRVVSFSLPRSQDVQEGQPNSLVRFDYYWSNLTNTNNSVNNVNNDLQNYKNAVYNTYLTDIRLGATYTKVINKNTVILADGGGVLIGYYFEGDNPQGDTLYMKPIQKAIGGNWYTIGQL